MFSFQDTCVYVYVCYSANMCVLSCTCPYRYVTARSKHWVSSFLTPHNIFWGKVSHCTYSSPFQLVWLPSRSTYLHTPNTEVTYACTWTGSYMGPRNLMSPHLLGTELSLQLFKLLNLKATCYTATDSTGSTRFTNKVYFFQQLRSLEWLDIDDERGKMNLWWCLFLLQLLQKTIRI